MQGVVREFFKAGCDYVPVPSYRNDILSTATPAEATISLQKPGVFFQYNKSGTLSSFITLLKLEEDLSIATICCDLVIAAHAD